ncbi:family 78 glycoside hydrolase catalytic domain [Pseudactinotalea terrae]|uniref:family 78 glycoside hydrolase catalytic domain n=1 Tax=Pseudactinotalea terrae TaxID=1743262 RepID=UPI0012E257FB|nr:family 78 glycoside hydrolase catalytic domain [Pseudactinotalea terrae]
MSSDALTTHGDWVTHPAWASDDPPWEQPTLRTRWTLERLPRRATLHVLGLGVWHATIGGVSVSEDVLEPGQSRFDVRVSARSYDVTDLLRAGSNELVVQLGEGPAHVRRAPGRYTKFVGSPAGGPRARVVLEIEDEDQVRLLASDASWQARLGPTTLAHWYGGEDYDARLEPHGWMTPEGSDDEGWVSVAVVGTPADGPQPWDRRAPGMRVLTVLGPVRTFEHDLSFVVDLGYNVAGFPRVEVTGLGAGESLTLRPAEFIWDDGTIDQKSIGMEVWDTFTSNGADTTWQPRFSYHGFQYLQVEQRDAAGEPVQPDPAAIRVQGLPVMANDRRTGHLQLGNDVLQQIDTLITRAAQSNMMTVPTDCPHREKLGWLEQTHLVFEPLAFRWDIRDHWHDLVTHMADAQTPEGLVPDIAPELVVFDFDWEPGFRDDVNWGGAIWHLPALLHRHYGTLEPARDAWDTGMRYWDYIETKAGDGVLGTGLGDWIALDETTPRPLVAGWGHGRMLDSAATVAGALDRPEDAERMQARAAQVRRQLADAYLDQLETGSQATAALLADAGVLDAEGQQRAVRRILALLAAGDDQLTVGEIGLPAILRVLSAAEEHEAIYRFVTQTAGLSYGRMVADGATSLLEHWTGMQTRNSSNHVMLGAVGTWFLESIAGLRQAPESVGWAHAVVSPRPLADVPTASLVFDSPAGTYELSWVSDETDLRVHVEVPEGTEARLDPPPGYEGASEVRGPGTHDVSYRRTT